jgi:hypothetical protein
MTLRVALDCRLRRFSACGSCVRSGPFHSAEVCWIRYRLEYVGLSLIGGVEVEMLTKKEAYEAMFAYLLEWYQLSGSDVLGSRLGDLSLLADGSTADPAAWEDWERAVAKVIGGHVDATLRLHRSE